MKNTFFTFKNTAVSILKILFIFILNISILYSEEFPVFGAKPLGLAGAYTAISDDTLATNWNPAGLYSTKSSFNVFFPLGLKLEFTGTFLQQANDIGQLADKYNKIEQKQKTGQSIDISELGVFATAIKNINELGKEDNGLLVNFGGGSCVKIGKFAISVNNYSYAALKPYTEFDFWLGSYTVTGITKLSNSKILQSENLYAGISISTVGVNSDDLNNQELKQIRDSLKTELDSWLLQTLSNAGVEIPSGITSSQIANVLINLADSNKVSKQEMENAVNTLSENKELIQMVLNNPLSIKNPFTDNNSNITFKGINITEITGSYSFNILKDLYLGINLKALIGKVGYYKQNIFESETKLEDITKNLDKYTKQSYQPAIDIGLMFDKISDFNTKFGLVIKNINRPKFELPEEAKKYNESDIYLDPQARLGIACFPFNWCSVSFDIDLTENKTFISGYKSKYFGLGSEINIINKTWLNIPLRIGIMKNLANSNSQNIYTYGIGFNLFHIVADISGAVSSKKVNINSTDSIPENASIQLNFGLSF